MTHRKPSWTKCWCRLQKARIECWDSEEESKDPEGKPKNVIKLNKVRQMSMVFPFGRVISGPQLEPNLTCLSVVYKLSSRLVQY